MIGVSDRACQGPRGFSPRRLLPRTRPGAGDAAKKWFDAHNVDVLLSTKVYTTPPDRAAGVDTSPAREGTTVLYTNTGSRLEFDLVLWCTGGKPAGMDISRVSGGFKSATGEEAGKQLASPGQLLPTEGTMKLEGSNRVFAAGDC